jgi:hypothetical protein
MNSTNEYISSRAKIVASIVELIKGIEKHRPEPYAREEMDAVLKGINIDYAGYGIRVEALDAHFGALSR